MKKVLLSAVLGLAILVSCEKKQEENAELVTTEQNATDEHLTDDHEKDDDHDESAKLELNNGAKWATNPEMKPWTSEMETQLNAYQPENGDYKMLGTNLNATNDNLVKSCTMTGTPHDALHAWLTPHMKDIAKLNKADNRDEANEIVRELKESMEKYHEHFN